MNITISGRAVGSRKPLFADWSVPVPPPDDSAGGDGGRTLRDLIGLVVRAEVAAYERRRDARRLDRVLSRTQIAEGLQQGRVAPEGRPAPGTTPADHAVAEALQAFEDGLYLVIIDGREVTGLDSPVYLSPSSRATFVRLVFLSGA